MKDKTVSFTKTDVTGKKELEGAQILSLIHILLLQKMKKWDFILPQEKHYLDL